MSIFDFNLYKLSPLSVCIDSDQYTFTNAPTTMAGTFIFIVIPAFEANKLQQLILMDSGNIIYTREYNGETATFSTWLTNGSGTGGISLLTSSDNSILISNPSGPTSDLKVPNGSTDISISGDLIASPNFVFILVDGLTVNLPLGSTVTPGRRYVIKNWGSTITTNIGVQGSDTLNGASSPFVISGAYNSGDFIFWETKGWFNC